jgi:hypothetical protein
MKRKKLPGFIKNPLIFEFFQSRPGRILSNWVFQGMLYMNPIEILYKLALDIVMTLAIVQFLLDPSIPVQWIYAWLIAHTLNWIINGQPVALLMHIDIGKNNPRKFISYIEGLEKRIKGKPFLAASASYGSLSVGGYKPTSDIDIRVILKRGLVARLRAAHFCFIERFRAFVFAFPLDLYAFTLEEVQRKMNPKEPPIVFYDPSGLLKKTYPDLVEFEEFRQHFWDEVLPAREA